MSPSQTFRLRVLNPARSRRVKTIGLIVGSIAVFVVAGLTFLLAIWIVLSGLFLASRFSNRVAFFTEWSWFQFLATVGSALGIPYLALLLSAGF